MSEGPDAPSDGLTRRRLLLGASAVALAGAAHAPEATAAPHAVALGAEAAGRSSRQHAWVAALSRDGHGNPVSPPYNRLLFFDIRGRPSPAHARVLEAALRTLERAFPWSPSGLLITAGWSPAYFERRLHLAPPLPRATAMSGFERPSLDGYDLCLHLAGDDERRLAAVEAALVHGAPLRGASGHLDLSSALLWRETRSGFVGAGLPSAHQNVGGIPPSRPVPHEAPLYMGFISSRRRNQATEDDVTIREGRFAGGTTMHVSYMRLQLEHWYESLSKRERVALMYAPQVTPARAAAFTTDALSDPSGFTQAARRYGMVGHAQSAGRARRGGRPRIIRRDFNTDDSGQAGVHFVSIQRTIEDFVLTRQAMNAGSAHQENPRISETAHNGINEFIFVLKRGNYIVPTRSQRSFPLLPGRERALRDS